MLLFGEDSRHASEKQCQQADGKDRAAKGGGGDQTPHRQPRNAHTELTVDNPLGRLEL